MSPEQQAAQEAILALNEIEGDESFLISDK